MDAIERVLHKAALTENFEATRGDCVEIALAMQEVFGGTIIAIGITPSNNEVNHAALRIDGQLYDARGRVTTEQLCREFIDPYANPEEHLWEPKSLSIYKNQTYESARQQLLEARENVGK